MFQKQTFGSTGTSSFGSFNAGASPFGGFKPATPSSAFGAPPAFGASATTQPATGGLFGGSSTSGGLFSNTAASTSTPAFGATGGGFGFGASTSTGGGLFSNNAGSNLFGNTQNTSAFGAKPAGFGFGSSPAPGTSTGGLFSSTPATGGLFAPQNNTMSGGGLFSNTAGGGFGQASTGTGHTKYAAVAGTDVIVKGGASQTINIKHHCITCMKEYENKSFEELRIEDYQAGRKGAPPGGMFAGGFGAQQPDNKPLFGGSTFGQPATTTSAVFGGGGLSTTGGFGQTNTFSFGSSAQPSTNTTGGLFGAAKPAFGATPTTGTGLFGATTTTQAPAFGTNTSTFGFGANTQNQSGGLFGAKTSTTGFGAPTSSSFGSFGGGGLFQAKPQQPAPAFGAAQPAFGATPGAFGSTPAPSGGLFSGSFGKPAAATPAFGFGTQPTLGSGLGTGLGANQAKPTLGAFGTGGTTAPFQQQQQTNLFQGGLGGGLFGGNTSLGAPSLGAGFNATNSSFNNNSLSGATNASNVHEQILTLAARPYGDSPLFKDLLPDSGTKAEDVLRPTNPAAVQAVLEASRPLPPRTAPCIRPRPLPSDKKSLFDGLEESDSSLEDKFSLKPSRKRLVLRPHASQPLSESDQNHRSIEEKQSDVGSGSNAGTPGVDNGQQKNDDNTDSKTHTPAEKNNSWLESSKQSWNEKEAPIDSEPTPRLYPNLDNEVAGQNADRRASWLTTKPLRKPLVTNPDVSENSVRELGVRSSDVISADKENVDSLSVVSDDEVVAPRETPPHPTGVKLTRPGYYTIPSLDQMIGFMRPDGSCVVPHLTIGRYNYGNVFYDCEIDVAGMDLDTLVHFFNKEVIIYPEDADKPPVGEGLNRRAIVTLERVWPRDKTQRKPITDCDRLMKMDYEGKLRRVCDKHDTKFVEYRPRTGSWVFRVEHFSKYGLTDSDEEDDAPEVMKRQLVSQQLQKAAPLSSPIPQSAGLGGLGVVPPTAQDNLFNLHQTSLNLLNGAGKAFEMDTTEDNAESQSLYQDNRAYGVKSPTSELARLENIQSHHVQLMKASLYADTVLDDDISVSTGDQLVPIYFPTPSVGKPQSVMTVEEEEMDTTPVTVDTSMQPMRPLVVQPHTMVLQYYRKVPPFKETIAGKLDASCLADMSICRARHSRVGFGPGCGMAFVTTQQVTSEMSLNADLCSLEDYVRGRSGDDWSMPRVLRLQIRGHIRESVTRHLETLLKFSEVTPCGEGLCPQLRVCVGASPRWELLRGHLAVAETASGADVEWGASDSYCLQVWRLCEALYGHDLDNEGITSMDVFSMVERHRRLLKWLVEAVADATERDLALPAQGEEQDEEDGHSRRVWTLLVGGRQKDACVESHAHSDLYTATLVAQANGDPTFKALVSRQLSLWRECGADSLISTHRIETLRLIAGEAHPINKLAQLDWLRAFHATARYLSGAVPSLEKVLQTYEELFQRGEKGELLPVEMGMQVPHPPHIEPMDTSNPQVLDLRYEIIRARATNQRPKLRPSAYTHDPLDYTIAFLLGTWYGSVSVSSVCGLSSQLEAGGLWSHAVQVAAYHPDHNIRGHLVRGILSRNAPAKADTPELKRHIELVRKLQVPEKWLRIAQANRAKYEHLPAVEAEHLAEAGEWNAAHKVLVDELLPEAVLSDDMSGVTPLLEKMNEAAERNEVSGWESGGLVLYHYAFICDEIRHSGGSNLSGSRLEALRPRIAAAGRALRLLPLPSRRLRAAAAEMAARLARLPRRQMSSELGERVSDSCVESSDSSPLHTLPVAT